MLHYKCLAIKLLLIFVLEISSCTCTESDTDKINRQQAIVKTYLREFEGNVVKFARDNIQNSKLREEYIKLNENAAQEVLQEARTTAAIVNPSQQVEIWEMAAKKASDLRNFHLEQTRHKISTIASAVSKYMKEEGLTYPALMEKYTRRHFGPDESYQSLELEQQQRVMESIVEASGRTNPTVNKWSKYLGRFGYASILVTTGLTMYSIAESENPIAEIENYAVSVGGGIGGATFGVQLGAYVGAIVGPEGALICAMLCDIVGGFLASLGAESVLNEFRSVLPTTYLLGPGQPLFDAIPAPYGQPKFDCLPLVPKPVIRGAPTVGRPVLREKPVPRPLSTGPPKLW